MSTYINVHLVLLQTVPASCVLGSSWADWRRIFAQSKYVPFGWQFLNSYHFGYAKYLLLGSSVSYFYSHYCNPHNTFRPNGFVEYLICLPAHGAVIGGWFGAWPMPLDWERPWQVISLFLSFVFEFIDHCLLKLVGVAVLTSILLFQNTVILFYFLNVSFHFNFFDQSTCFIIYIPLMFLKAAPVFLQCWRFVSERAFANLAFILFIILF